MNTTRIRNPHAILKLVRAMKRPTMLRTSAKWPALAAPIYPEDTDQRIRAQSLLAGIAYRDGSTNPDSLTLAQAQDVLRWATARIR